jgi:hypothetical protein
MIKTIETISDEEFDTFFKQLPERVKLIVKGGLADWKEVLPEWYEKYKLDKYLLERPF